MAREKEKQEEETGEEIGEKGNEAKKKKRGVVIEEHNREIREVPRSGAARESPESLNLRSELHYYRSVFYRAK